MYETNIFILLRFGIGLLRFRKGLKHLLYILIILEFIVLIVFLLSILFIYPWSQYMSIVLLIFRVCEGALGLTILVTISRGLGGGYFNRFCLTVI